LVGKCSTGGNLEFDADLAFASSRFVSADFASASRFGRAEAQNLGKIA
jgi:hypothetical protein